MNDQQQWLAAVRAVADEFADLEPHVRAQVGELAGEIRSRKAQLHALVAEHDIAALCRECGGQCCALGRLHFTVVDLLAFLSAGEPLFTPEFAAPDCPYLRAEACLMTPAFRPYNCVSFICEQVEALLTSAELADFYHQEQVLRRLYRQMEALFGNRFMHGLLVNFERTRQTGGDKILRGKG
jgi:hypothetical protein